MNTVTNTSKFDPDQTIFDPDQYHEMNTVTKTYP